MQNAGFRIKWLSIACFEMQKDDHHIVTDPFVTLNEYSPCTIDDVEACDMITLSHVHWDHIPDIPALMSKYNQPPLLTGSLSALPLCLWGNLCPESVYPMDAGLELDFDWVKVKALFGRHVSSRQTVNEQDGFLRRMPFVDRSMGDMQILGSLEYRNFLFTFPDGLKVLIWGNEFVPVQKNIVKELKPDVAIIQATKQLRDPESFCEFVKLSGAKTVIPHHMDLVKPYEDSREDLTVLKKKIESECSGTQFILPEYNTWINI